MDALGKYKYTSSTIHNWQPPTMRRGVALSLEEIVRRNFSTLNAPLSCQLNEYHGDISGCPEFYLGIYPSTWTYIL
jgi:hypothetical protein